MTRLRAPGAGFEGQGDPESYLKQQISDVGLNDISGTHLRV